MADYTECIHCIYRHECKKEGNDRKYCLIRFLIHNSTIQKGRTTMIDHRIRGEDLIGRKCRPVQPIRNGNGDGVSPDTVCTIIEVVRGHGFTIQTEKCPHCVQYAYIRRVKREELELIAEVASFDE